MNKEKILSLLRRNLLLTAAIYVMTFGVSLFLRSNLGSSAISAIPYVWSGGGAVGASVAGWSVPALTVGGYTIIMNFLFVFLQIIILRRRFEPVQLGQLVIGTLFSFFLDFNMFLTAPLAAWEGLGGFLWGLALVLVAGVIMGIGVACEVRCKSVMMPGEGIQVAIARVLGKEFSKVKIVVDVTLVAIGVVCSFLFFGCWRWDVIGLGTLISMVYIGLMVRFFNPHLGWFDRLLGFDNAKMPDVAAHGGAVRADGRPSAQSYPLVVTISRQKGSGGREIGEKVAARLGIPIYDNEILLRSAQELSMAPGEAARREQNLSTSRLVEKLITDDYIPQGTVLSTDDRLFVAQSHYIREAADHESCVIIGRCADKVLAGRPNVIRVFIRSNINFAAQRMAQDSNGELTLLQAMDKIEEVNTARANHYLRYTGKRWGDAANYDLVLNTSAIGIDKAVDIICGLK